MKNRRDWKAPEKSGALPLAQGQAATATATAERPKARDGRQFLLVPGSPVADGWYPHIKQVTEAQLRGRGLDPDEAIRRGAVTEV